jgi:hypothetical protein
MCRVTDIHGQGIFPLLTILKISFTLFNFLCQYIQKRIPAYKSCPQAF